MQTHPPEGLHGQIIRAWYGDLTGIEIAAEYNLKPITIYAIWCRAKKSGKLPKQRRHPANLGDHTADLNTGGGVSAQRMLYRVNEARRLNRG